MTDGGRQIEVTIPISRTMNPIYASTVLDDVTPIQIIYGGSSSGKSKYKAQEVIEKLLSGGRNYLIVRKTRNSIRGSTFKELKKVIDEWDVANEFEVLETTMTITCSNGYQAVFAGLDNVQKLKSVTASRGVITDIWIEEATEISKDDFKELTKRLRGKSDVRKRVTMTFNPILQSHWIYKSFFEGAWDDSKQMVKGDKWLILKTTYKDNMFLTDQDIEALEDETDEYYHNVYTLGNWGVLGHLVFTNWKVIDTSEHAYMFDRFNNGLDFGFSNDLTALVRAYVHPSEKAIYITDEYINKGVTNERIAEDIKPIVGGEVVVCDSSEPKSIAELNACEIAATPARKGPDSVLQGIMWLQRHTIYVDVSCKQTQAELSAYHWIKDKDGNVLNKPADRDNHCMDALRYAMEEYMLAAKSGRDEASSLGSVEAMEVFW